MPNYDESLVNPDWSDYIKFPAAGWINFWSSFTNTSLEDFILNIYDKIEIQTNPLHEDNIDEFNATLDLIKSDTFIGSFYTISTDYLPEILSHMNGSQATFTFNTAGVSNSYYSIPAKSITIDMSWYLPFKPYGDMVLSGFMWLGFIFLLFKRAPDIINGAGMITDIVNQPVEPDFTTHDNITVDDNGTVTNHSTTYRYKSGYTVTQKHDV